MKHSLGTAVLVALLVLTVVAIETVDSEQHEQQQGIRYSTPLYTQD
jgi:CHASE1-domain containing sensor protein